MKDVMDYMDEGCREICAPQEVTATHSVIDEVLYYVVLGIAFTVCALMAWPH